MTLVLLIMAAVLIVAAAVLGMVLIGMAGRGADRAPVVGRHLTKAAQHLNGEAAAPQKFVRMVESSLTR